jgi:hypothetical protein
MASPPDDRARYFATYDWAGLHIRWEITSRFDPTTAVLLDVGAGWGKYADLLPGWTIDAVEAWKPNITGEQLDERYRKVWHADVADLDLGFYDAVVMGDVFEHLSRQKAHLVLDRLLPRCDEIYVAVPFEYPQGAVDHNPYEAHLQDDLTPELMAAEYPQLWLLATGDGKGLYVKESA